MAEEVLSIKITADNSDAVAGLKQTETSMQNVSAAFKQQQVSAKGLENATKDVISTNGKMNASLGEMKSYLKDLKAELDATVNPAQFKEVKTEIDKTAESIKSLQSKGGTDGGFGSAISGARKFQFILRSFAGVGLFAIFDVLYQGLSELALGFDKAEKLANKFQDSYTKGMATAVGGAEAEAASVKALVKSIEDETISRNHRQEALDNLKKSYPEYFDQQGIDIDNTKALEKANSSLELALIRKSKVQALTTLLGKAYEAQAESETNTVRQQIQALSGWEKAWTFLKGSISAFNPMAIGVNTSIGLVNEGIKNNSDIAKDAAQNITSLTKALDNLVGKQVTNGDLKTQPKKYGEATVKNKLTDTSEFKGKFRMEQGMPVQEHLLEVEKEMVKLKEKELAIQEKIEAQIRLGEEVDRKLTQPKNNAIEEAQVQLTAQRTEETKNYTETLKQQTSVANNLANSFGNIMAQMANTKDPFKTMTEGLKQMVIQLGIAVAKALIFDAIMAAITGGTALASGAAKAGAGLGSALLGGMIPQHAEGGITTGPSIGMIGEAGPEAILPLDRFRGFVDQAGKMGAMSAMANNNSGGGSGEFTLRGNDLVLALQRSNYSLNLRR